MEFLPNKLFTEQYDFVDLSYPLNSNTIFWPGGEGFTLCMNCVSSPEHGYDYAAGCFTCAEHGGTHVDAPFHFNKDGITVDLIPLKQLIGKLRIIDIKEKCADPENMNCRDYCLSADDILRYENVNGKLENDDIVIVRTGWHQFYEQGPKAYLGFDEKVDGKYDDNSRLSFPGIGSDAAALFVERRIVAVGLDAGKPYTTCSH
jgi:kynurenine formamidase